MISLTRSIAVIAHKERQWAIKGMNMIARILGVDSQKITMGNCEECMAIETLETLLGFDVPPI